jgi:4-amino-4-deoxy-L-arabinose transferase-like glycosyltransferase
MQKITLDKNSKKLIILISFLLFITAFVVRFNFYIDTNIRKPLIGDAKYYVVYANNIVKNNTFSKEKINPKPDSFWSPGYPTFLAINLYISEITGFDYYDTVVIFQMLLGSIVVVLTFLLGNMFLNFWWSLSAALLTIISPHLISYSIFLITETLFSFLLLSGIYFFCSYLNKNRKYLLWLSGLIFGLAYLTNQVLFFYPLLIILLLAFFKKITLRKSIPFFLIYFIFVFSWSIRNSINVEEGSLDSSNRLLTNLVIGMHADYHDIWRKNPRDPNNPADIDLIKFNGSYSLFLETLADRIKNSPMHYLKWYFIEKPINLWGWEIAVGSFDVFVYPVITSPYHSNTLFKISHKVMKTVHYWLFLFSCLSLVLMVYYWKQTKVEVVLIIGSIIYVSAVYVITQADSRYSVPLRPEMYLLAMYFLQICSIEYFKSQNKINS